jgi:large subunit ribosomal protein L31
VAVDWPVFRAIAMSESHLQSVQLNPWGKTMKSGIHPEYREVVFQDMSSDFAFLTRSTIESKETIKWEDGNEYPLVKVEVSSASHPFYTGKHKVLDSGGRVDRFKKRYGK